MSRPSTLIRPNCDEIRKRRHELGLSAGECAAAAGISLATWSNAERCNPISKAFERRIMDTLDAIEAERSTTPAPTVEDLRAVLQEQRELRKLVEELIAQLGSQR